MDSTSILFHHESVLRIAPYVIAFASILLLCSAFRLANAQKKIFKKSVFPIYLRFTFCGTIALASILVAFAGAYQFKTDILQENISAKIAIGVDNSASMAASDISSADKTSLAALGLRPSRLGLCIANINNALVGLEGVEVILFTFSGSVDLRTGDWIQLGARSSAGVTSLLRDIEPAFLGSGTEISRLFEEAHHILQKEPSFMLLCSDGGKAGTNSGDAVLRLKVVRFAHGDAKDRNIPVYTLGTGTPGTPAPIPFTLPDGRVQGFIRDHSGNNVFTEYDALTLRQIASISGGMYMHADGVFTGRELLRSAIMHGLRTSRKVSVINPKDLSLPFIVIALFFFLITSGSFSFLRWFKRPN